MWQLHSNPFEWSTSNPTQMSPTKITSKPLFIMSSGFLMDHSKNTIGMDLIIIFIYLFIFLPLMPTNGMGHMFFWPNAWNVVTVEWVSTPHVTLFHMQSVCKELKGFAINFMSLIEILSFATNHYATNMQLVVVCNYLGHVCNYKFGIV
jgi:hypothetical protein